MTDDPGPDPRSARRRHGIYLGPHEEELRRRWHQERHAVVLRLHPDRGGDAEQMLIALEAVDARFEGLHDDGQPASSRWPPVSRAWHRTRRGAGRLVRRAQARIPRRWPGHRRYFDL